MSKPKTQAQRRQELFDALERMRVATASAAFKQGMRASEPAKYDNAEVRAREDAALYASYAAQGKCVAIYNAAVRAARRKA